MHKFENIESPKNKFEIMQLPEIVIKDKKNLTLAYILLSVYKNDYNNENNELVNKLSHYFRENKLNKDILDPLKEIKVSEKDGIDDELIYNICLTDNIRDLNYLEIFAKKHKNYNSDINELSKYFFELLKKFEEELPDQLRQDFDKYISTDISVKSEEIGDYRDRIKKLIEFFKVKRETTNIKELVLLPANPLLTKQSGAAFIFPDKVYIQSDNDNKDNFEHEFLHSVINPIVNKLDKQLSNEEKEKLSSMAPYYLKAEKENGGQDYGTNYFSLLCEEFIRTYIDVYKKKEGFLNYSKFNRFIQQLKEEEFNLLLENKVNFRIYCKKLNINSLKDLKDNGLQFYDKFLKNELRVLVYKIYQDFESRDNKNMSFEDFILNKFKNYI